MTMIVANGNGPPPDGKVPTVTPSTQPMFLHGQLPSEVPVTTSYDTLLRIDIHRSPNAITDYPIKPFLRDFLDILQKVNNKNCCEEDTSTRMVVVSPYTTVVY